VRFAYLDFSTLARREAACRAELRLNRRLAPTVYLDVVPLTVTPRGLAIGGSTTITDWLVVMRRLLLGERPQAIFEAAFPQHLPNKMPIGAKMRRDAVTSSTLIIVLAPAFRF
jgi:aminoglycoside phosphotransferase family enzyme